MSDWVDDVHEMHRKFGFHERVANLTPTDLKSLLRFRINFIREEFYELLDAQNSEDVVDALIDICVVAIGTLDLFGVDAKEAWDRVHRANMAKERGIKEGRPNPFGFPDLVKPEGWVGPSHDGNVGTLGTLSYDR